MLWSLLFFVMAWAGWPGESVDVGIHRNGLATSQTARLPGQDFALLRHVEGCEFAIERYGPDLAARWSTPLGYEARMAMGNAAYAGQTPGCLLKAYTPIYGPLIQLHASGKEVRVFAVQDTGVVVDRIKPATGETTRETLMPPVGNAHVRVHPRSGHVIVISHHGRDLPTEARFFGPDLRQVGQAAWSESDETLWRQYSLDSSGRLYVLEHLEDSTWHVHQVRPDGTRRTLSWYDLHDHQGVPVWTHDAAGQVVVAVRSGDSAANKEELVVTALDFKSSRFRWQVVGGMSWLFPTADAKELRLADPFDLVLAADGSLVVLSQVFAVRRRDYSGLGFLGSFVSLPYDGLYRLPATGKTQWRLGEIQAVSLDRKGQVRWVQRIPLEQKKHDDYWHQVGSGYSYSLSTRSLRLVYREVPGLDPSLVVKDLSLADGALSEVARYPVPLLSNWARDLALLQPSQLVLLTMSELRTAQLRAVPLE